MTQNVIWYGEGAQISPEKHYYYFPFKSLTFYAPQGYNLSTSNIGIDTIRDVCKDLGEHIWVKTPMFDVVDDSYDGKLILSDERCTKIWNFIEEEMKDNEDLTNHIKKYSINENMIKSMDNDEIETFFNHFIDEENLNRLKELWLRNDSISLINLRPMIITLLSKYEEDGLHLCQSSNDHIKIIDIDDLEDYNDNIKAFKYNRIKGCNNKKISILLENLFQLIEDTLKSRGENPSDFNISMIVCRGNHRNQDLTKTIVYNANKSFSNVHIKESIPPRKLGGHITTPKNKNVVAVSEEELYEYLSGSGGSLPQRKGKTKRKRKGKTKRKGKRKRKNKTKRKRV